MATSPLPPIIDDGPRDEMDCLLLIIQALMRINGNLEKLLARTQGGEEKAGVRASLRMPIPHVTTATED